jgi:uncharacterized membrane protein YkvA (DUF1232 family)
MLTAARRIVLCWRLFWDPRVSVYLKLIPLGAVLYVASPMDLVPDVAIPVLGYLDDFGVFLIAIELFARLCPRHVVADHRYWVLHSRRVGLRARPRRARERQAKCPPAIR